MGRSRLVGLCTRWQEIVENSGSEAQLSTVRREPDQVSPALPQALGCCFQGLQVAVKLCLVFYQSQYLSLPGLAHCLCTSPSPVSSHYPQFLGPSRPKVTAMGHLSLCPSSALLRTV